MSTSQEIDSDRGPLQWSKGPTGVRTGRIDMQFGIFSVGDVTTDPTTGTTVSEHERIKAMTAIALKA